jgi:uncharacterized membrane protein YphA (DoxX/SURF4 family)
MISISRVAFRWAMAYLLLVNSVDTLANTISTNQVALAADWLTPLLMLTTMLSIVGSVLLAFGWRLSTSAPVLAACTALFALIYQEPVALFITAGLLMLAYDAHTQRSSTVQSSSCRNAHAASEMNPAHNIKNCHAIGC